MKPFLKIFCFALLLAATFYSCGDPPGVYYSYNGLEGQELFPGDKNTVKFKCTLESGTIKDTSKPFPLALSFGFNGNYNAFPKRLKVELYYDGRKLNTTDSVDITITTVLDGSVRYFNRKDSLCDIDSVVAKLIREKPIPPPINYMTVAARYISLPMGNAIYPQKLKITAKIYWDGGKLEKEFEFELGEREFGSGRSRLYG